MPAELLQAPMIELDSIAKEFGSARAVRHVSLAVGQGEFVSLLGPSGCGKTTTLRIIAGFEHPSGGSLRIGGRDMTDVPVEKRGVSMVFQNYALFPHLSVFENVAFGLRLRRLPWAEIASRTHNALDRVGLTGLEERRPRQLSGGQQQRVSLARALVVNPSVLLLDEPLSNLDLKLREQLRDEIRTLQRTSGITAIYVTHDQVEAMAMSDRIAVMNAGVIEQLGTPREIYERPRTVFVASFIGQCNLLSGRFEASRFHTPKGLTFTVQGQTPTPDMRLAIRPEAITISSDTNGTNGAADNRFKGRVAGTTYLGDRAQLDIVLVGPTGEDAETIAAVWPMRRGEEVPAIGRAVTIAVDAADCVPVATTAGLS